ncbi:uncharacterized protein LOC135476774 [Liolophura sinensis]|uniref:uncharacterized protein LOC135476774 n=1 Tax=Liolophura sinensis TaxID=3198878 RepID=UPI0031598D35
MQKTDIVGRMRSGPFSLATDGSNDQQDKQFPMVVTTCSEQGIHTDLLGVPLLNKMSATGENIFKLLDSVLRSRNIPWSNCLAFGTDNANVMVGCRKGVYAFILGQEPSIYLSGCPCHLLHHAAEKAASCFPFSIDNILVDTYYYLDKSSKRQTELDSLQTLYEVNHREIIKHVPTRWLSIAGCLDRILENWDALKVYFVTEKTNLAGQSTTYKQAKVNNLETFYRSPTNRLYCIFLKFALLAFDKLNTTLQTEKPLIHKLRRLLNKLMRDLLVRFVVPKALHGKPMTKVQFNDIANHKKNDDIIIGEEARNFLANAETNRLRGSRVEEFFENAKQFYIKACDYICKKLPLNDELLKKAEVADVELRVHNCSGDLQYFLDRFPSLMPPDTTKDQVNSRLKTSLNTVALLVGMTMRPG